MHNSQLGHKARARRHINEWDGFACFGFSLMSAAGFEMCNGFCTIVLLTVSMLLALVVLTLFSMGFERP